MKAKSKSTRTTKQSVKPDTARKADDAQLALLRLKACMAKIAAAGGLLKLAVDQKLPDNEYVYLDADEIYELCAAIVREESQHLYQYSDDLTSAAGIEFNYQRAVRIAEEREEEARREEASELIGKAEAGHA